MLGRAGKATGKNKFFMNVRFDEGDCCLDFEKKVVDWKMGEVDIHEQQQCPHSEVLLENGTSVETQEAMEKELCSWHDNKVYTEVKDFGQPRISTRWVYTQKQSNGKSFVKARLVARGFEDQEASLIRTDSPTCSKEGLRIALMIMQANHWVCNSLDFKTAFLQSNPFSREVYMSPPVEAKTADGTIWKLLKSIYGLNDAPRSWYISIREELVKLGAEPSKYDEALYTWYVEGKLHGVISTHVDDFCWGGTKLFMVSIMDKIRKKYKIGVERKNNFKYLGLNVSQKNNVIQLDLKSYLDSLEMIPDANLYSRNSEDIMNEKQQTLARSAIGKLNWLATQTRPDLCYDVSMLTSKLKTKKTSCLSQINNVIKKAKMEKSAIGIYDLGNLDKIKIVGFCDASFGNLDDGGSQGGYIIFLVGENNKYIPLTWQSKKTIRVVKSTLAAETLAAVDLSEACIFYRKLLFQLFHLIEDPEVIPIFIKTDNASLCQSIQTSTQILDKRLRIEMAILKEMIEKKEIKAIRWISTKDQLADCFTKKGIPSWKILNFL